MPPTDSAERSERPLLRMVWLAVLVIFVLAAVAAAFIHSQIREGERGRAAVDHSAAGRFHTQTVFSLLQDAETGQRGFLLTGDDSFLTPYKRAVAAIPGSMDQLAALYANQPEQHARVVQLRETAQNKLAEMDAVIASYRLGEETAAIEQVRAGEGLRIMERIREINEALAEHSSRELEMLTRQQARKVAILRGIVYGLLAAIALLTLGAGAMLVHHLRGRMRLETALRGQERRLDAMRGIADACSLSTDFRGALRRTVDTLVNSFAFEASAALVKRRRKEVEIESVVNAGGSRPIVAAAGTLRELGVRIEAEDHTADGEADGGCWHARVPVSIDGDPVAVVELRVPRSRMDMNTLRSLCDYMQTQLGHAAMQQRAHDELHVALVRQRAVFDGALDGFLTINQSGSIETMNPAAERMFGVAASEVERRHASILLDASHGIKAGPFADMRAMLARRGAISEVQALRSSGDTFPADLALSEVDLGDRRLYVAAVRDISERKRVERMKTEFVSTVSHELRTPLTSIAGSLGLLVGGVGGELPASAMKLIEIARRNSERLVRLVNDILDIEKIESGNMHFDIRPVSLRALLGAVIEANRGFASEFGVELALADGDADPVVMADADRLTQVMTNLVSNAVKFSSRGQTVTIALAMHDGMARMSVIDRGPGIAPEFRARIFGKFAQADASDSRNKGGTGLGLSIVKQITERLDGRVSFDSEIGRGTTFHVDLPLAPAETVEAIAEPAMRILLCTADTDVRARIHTALAAAGVGCDDAHDDATAMQRLAEYDYLAVLIDVALTGRGSVDLVRAMHEGPAAGRVPIIFVGAPPEAGTGVYEGPPILDWRDWPPDTDRLVTTLRQTLSAHRGARPLVLHVDDDPDVLGLVQRALMGSADVHPAATLQEARQFLALREPDLVILDLTLTEGSALELMPRLKTKSGRGIPVVIFSAQDADPTLQAEVEAMLTKSHASLQQLADTVLSIIHLTGRREGPASP